MRKIALAVVALAAPLSAQNSTTNCYRIGAQVQCDTRSNQRSSVGGLSDYADTMSAAQRLVPDYHQQELQDAQTKNLRLQNDMLERQNYMMQRQLTLQAAPGYDAKQCRKSAKGALDMNDLALARDVLNACVAQ